MNTSPGPASKIRRFSGSNRAPTGWGVLDSEGFKRACNAFLESRGICPVCEHTVANGGQHRRNCVRGIRERMGAK